MLDVTMEIPKPFVVRRFGPKGADSHKHTFCVTALGNKEAVRLKFGGESAAIHGASGSDPKDTRAACERLRDALNEQFAKYWRGEFHVPEVSPKTALVPQPPQTLHQQLSHEYWPDAGANDSADRERGDAAVDELPLGQLADFFAEWQFGPTYCMVARRVQELLRRFPPHIEDRKARALAALESAKRALQELNSLEY